MAREQREVEVVIRVTATLWSTDTRKAEQVTEEIVDEIARSGELRNRLRVARITVDPNVREG